MSDFELELVELNRVALYFKYAGMIKIDKLFEILEKEKFSVTEIPINPIPDIPFQIGREKSATKSGVKVRYLKDSALVFDGDFKKSTAIIKEVIGLLKKNFDLDSEKAFRTNELTFVARYKSNNSAKQKLYDFVGESKLKKFDDVFGEKTTSMTVRLIPSEKEAIDEDWYDLIVELLISNPSLYLVKCVYRKESLNSLLDFLNKFDGEMVSVLNIIEG